MSDYFLYDNQLYHYGVKGMKWGVRKDQNKKVNTTSNGKKQHKEQSEKIRKTVEDGAKKSSSSNG